MTKPDGQKDIYAYVAAVRKQVAQQTGLVCPKCKQPVAVIDHQDESATLTFRYPSCGHQWQWNEPEKPKQSGVKKRKAGKKR